MNIFVTNRGIDRRTLTLLLASALAVLVLSGCSQKKEPAEAAVVDGKIVIKGSNTIGEELAPRLIAEYKKDHPGVSFDFESKGTASGFDGLLASACDIAGASRVVKPEELQKAQAKGIELNPHAIGSYTVAVVVNSANPVKDLTRDQIRDIFTGLVQNWKEVGGPDAPIHLNGRDPISGTYLGFRELAMEDKAYATGLKTFTNYIGIVQAVGQDTNGIGYASIDLLNKPGVKPISVRGVPPTILSIKEGRYPFSRILRFYTNQSKESALTRDFIRFVQSPRGQDILEEMGFVRSS